MSRGYEIHDGKKYYYDDNYEPFNPHVTRTSSHTIVFEEATRVVVVDNEGGRVYDKTVFEGVEIHIQDGGKTLKIFPMT